MHNTIACTACPPLRPGFYTGERWGLDSSIGVSIRADASRRVIPLFVRAGSILPLGPRKQWSEERVYVSPPTHTRTRTTHHESVAAAGINHDTTRSSSTTAVDG